MGVAMPTMEETGLGAVNHASIVAAVTDQHKNDYKRSPYVKYSEMDCFMIGNYTNENGPAAATVFNGRCGCKSVCRTKR